MTDLDAPPAAPGRLLSRPLVLLLALSFGSLASLYLLLPVVPLYVAASGGGDAGAGAATGVMMLSTVLAEFAVPGLLARCGYRAGIAAGLVLLGGGSLAMTASPALALVLVACVARGAGLAVVVVAGPVLVAELVPERRRGEALGVYGLAVGVPAIVGLPLGLWSSLHFGYGAVMVAGAAPALLALLAVPGLPRRPRSSGPHAEGLGGLRGLTSLTVVFAANTLAAGVLLTFLPLAVPAGGREVAALALLVHAAAMPLARWAAGRHGDRHGPAGLLVPSVLVAAAGMAAVVWLDEPYAVVAGAAVFGAGFGAAQNVTLALMFQRAPRSGFGRVSALWNLAYDGGLGVGAVGFGLVAGPAGYTWGFALTAAVLFAALVPAWRART